MLRRVGIMNREHLANLQRLSLFDFPIFAVVLAVKAHDLVGLNRAGDLHSTA